MAEEVKDQRKLLGLIIIAFPGKFLVGHKMNQQQNIDENKPILDAAKPCQKPQESLSPSGGNMNGAWSSWHGQKSGHQLLSGEG